MFTLRSGQTRLGPKNEEEGRVEQRVAILNAGQPKLIGCAQILWFQFTPIGLFCRENNRPSKRMHSFSSEIVNLLRKLWVKYSPHTWLMNLQRN